MNSDSEFELEIEGDDEAGGKKRTLADMRAATSGLTGGDLLPKRDAIDELFADWEPQLPFSCKLTLEDVSIGDEKTELKTYMIQILKSKDAIYGLFCRWSSKNGVSDYSINKTESFDEAVTFFKEKFYEKTFNSWDQREIFKVKPGAYRWIGSYREHEAGAMDLETNPEKRAVREKLKILSQKIKSQTNKLSRELSSALKLLFDLDESEGMLESFSINKARLWLGDLDLRNLLRAHKVLSDIEYQISGPTRRNQKIFEMSAEFFHLIPQNFKIAQNQIIDDLNKLKKTYHMLQMLVGIYHQVAVVKQVESYHPDDRPVLEEAYSLMGCQLKHVSPTDSPVYSDVAKMFGSHGQSHMSMKLLIKDVFEVQREGQFQAFFPFRKLARRMLWLGAPTPKVFEYLSKGVTLIKKESVNSAGFFGKALYLTDVVSKAAKHCGIEERGREGFLLLCDVATGNEFPTMKSKIYSKPPTHYHSIRGAGKFESSSTIDFGGSAATVAVPEQNLKNIDSIFMYNEFAVFDEGQVKICYLVKVEFHF